MGGIELIAAVGTLLDSLCNPRNRPNLTVVGVTAELEIDSGLGTAVKVVGLMVENNRVVRFFGRKSLHQLGDALAVGVGSVVAPDDGQMP